MPGWAPGSGGAATSDPAGWPYEVERREDCWIPLPSGTGGQQALRLSCSLWLPHPRGEPQTTLAVPAVLEYLPYRWGDATYIRDYCRHPYVCGHGFAVVRVDIRGSGDSEGEYHGEYLAQEQEDCRQVLAWIAAQPWCSGAVGMYGKSWGGFNGLQMASLRPPELRSVISLYSTDDRYATDVHYQGGAIVAYQMLSWSSVMFSYDARPPTPHTLRSHQPGEGAAATVGRAREAWRNRLEASSGPCVQDWLAHPLRDKFWQHGSPASVGVDGQQTIEIPTLLIGGAADGYTDVPFRMLASQPAAQRGSWRALVGPWGHDWPDIAAPGPNIGFLQEIVQWWQATLALEPAAKAAVDATPLLRTFVADVPPPIPEGSGLPGSAVRTGRWLAQDRFATVASGNGAAAGTWPACFADEAKHMELGLFGAEGALLSAADGAPEAAADVAVSHRGQPLHGSKSGDWLGCKLSRFRCHLGCILVKMAAISLRTGGDAASDDGPDEQSIDDGLSLCLTSRPLPEPVTLVGFPALRATVAVDQSAATLSARLTAVMPDGTSWLLSRGSLNLNHVPGSNHPASRAIEPGEPLPVELDLAAVSVQVPAGARIRLALSPYNWPLIWPAAGPAALLSLLPGSTLSLPLTHASASFDWQPPPCFSEPTIGPVCPTEEIRPSGPTTRSFTQHPGTGAQVLTVTEDGGLLKVSPRAVAFGEDTESTYTLSPRAIDGVASAVITRRYETRYDLEGGMVWRTVIETTAEMRDAAGGEGLELRHTMRVSDACCAEAEAEDDGLLAPFWEGEWEATAPSQAQVGAVAKRARAAL